MMRGCAAVSAAGLRVLERCLLYAKISSMAGKGGSLLTCAVLGLGDLLLGSFGHPALKLLSLVPMQ
jgi:hypothetical protein